MRVSKTKKTFLVRKTVSPAFNQSFDIKLTEKCVDLTFLTVQLKQARLFALKGCRTQTHVAECERIYFLYPDLTLGSVIIGSAMFARQSGLRQWERALSSQETKQHVREVHALNTPALNNNI